MSEHPQRFPIRLSLRKPLPAEFDAGAPFLLPLAVETNSRVDLSGAPYQVTDEDGTVVASGVLPTITRFSPDSDDHDPRREPVDTRDSVELMLTAPREMRPFSWMLILDPGEIDGVAHEPASVAISGEARQHHTSLAVWDTPSPAIVGETVRISVGAKCSSGCSLAGETVELVDAAGAVVGRSVIGDATWPGTEALHWTSIEAPAPTTEGQHHWLVRMADHDGTGLHAKAGDIGVTFMTVRPPKNDVLIELFEVGKGEPLAEAYVRVGPFRSKTGEDGSVRFRVPDGDYTVSVFKDNHETPEQTLTIDHNVALRLEAKYVPPEDPYSFYWKT